MGVQLHHVPPLIRPLVDGLTPGGGAPCVSLNRWIAASRCPGLTFHAIKRIIIASRFECTALAFAQR
jgi:hypothetical protein